MVKKLSCSILLLCLFFSFECAADNSCGIPELTGDKKLACEALLCLSSPHRPKECRAALKHLYSIKRFKHGVPNLSRTINARKDFLKLCPTDDNSVQLLAGIAAKTVNQCDPDSLNNRYVYYGNKFDVLTGKWEGWKLLGRKNDDFGTRNKFYFNQKNYPNCTDRQLNYAWKLAAGLETGSYIDPETDSWTYPIPVVCWDIKGGIDSDAPKDCRDFMRNDATYYKDVHYKDGKWVHKK